MVYCYHIIKQVFKKKGELMPNILFTVLSFMWIAFLAISYIETLLLTKESLSQGEEKRYNLIRVGGSSLGVVIFALYVNNLIANFNK